MLIRRERPGDEAAIAQVHALAFQDERHGSAQPVEVRLVADLRRSDAWLPRLSLVAVLAEEIVGHAVCSRAVIQPRALEVLGLAPIGVRPDHQRQGVGSALMHALLGAADACDERLVGLVGDPAYYHRFGFVPAAERGIRPADPALADYFQVRRLSACTEHIRGRFHYAPAFDEL